MSTKTPLLVDLAREPDVSRAQYAGKITCTRKKWFWRFVFLAAVGVFLLATLGRLLYQSSTGYNAHYVLFGRSSLEISLSDAELIFSATLKESNLAQNWSYEYTQEPHLSGDNEQLVDWTVLKFKDFGLKNVHVESYDVYLNSPVDHALRLLEGGKTVYEASLKEDPIAEDPTTQKRMVPTYHAYSANGNVTSTYFYANYGRKEDYQKLADHGLNLTGKIAIVRYGAILRGLKIKFAEELGVVGVIIYSDPGDDGDHIPQNGFKQYPKGPSKHELSVERGSVMYLTEGAGDPTTPGYASKKGAKRQDPRQFIPKIPSLPVSYRDILPILKKLNGLGTNGANFGKDWVGKLEGYDYSIGLSVKQQVSSPLLNLCNEQKYDIKPIHNVLGTIPGLVSNEVVVVGNHRDSWVRGGAGDPNSGSSVLLEILRAFQAATAKGYVPYRTLVFGSWDGEESGLLGSTEWGEDHSSWIQGNVVAYMNLDMAVSGTSLLMGSSPMLKELLIDVSKTVEYPQGGSLYDHHQSGIFKGEVLFLGSGSDFAVFVDHLGVPALDAEFSNNPSVDPVYHYHSSYDSFYWMDKFGDPGFVYHNIMAQYFGKILLRMSGLEFSPLDPYTYALEVDKYFSDALKKVPMSWYHYKASGFSFDLGKGGNAWSGFSLSERKRFPKQQGLKDFTDAVKVTKKAIHFFQEQAKKAVEERDVCQAKLNDGVQSYWARFRLMSRLIVINAKFNFLERVFLHSDGLKGRPWFKHIMFASGRFTGYDGQAIPGFLEAVEDNEMKDGLRWVNVLWQKVYLAGLMLSV